MYQVEMTYHVELANGTTFRDIIVWRGSAKSDSDALSYALSDVSLAYQSAYGKSLNPQVRIESFTLNKVEPCPRCKGTGKRSNLYGETRVCDHCSGSRYFSVNTYHVERSEN